MEDCVRGGHRRRHIVVVEKQRFGRGVHGANGGGSKKEALGTVLDKVSPASAPAWNRYPQGLCGCADHEDHGEHGGTALSREAHCRLGRLDAITRLLRTA